MARWLTALRAAMPGVEVGAEASIVARAEIAVAANPAPGALADAPNLRLVHSAWAGVEGLLADSTLPAHVPLARLIDPELGDGMAEAALSHVLMLHRHAPLYRAQQAERVWRPQPQPRADERRVGLLGLGEMGRRAAARLVAAGFDVAGWSRGGAALGGVEVFAGADGLARLLARSEIVVNLLPLTAETRGILGASAFATMPEGAALVNLARGGHVDEAALVAALDGGRLAWAVLDVVATEPLPAGDPLWRHPRVILTPHVAAVTRPQTAARLIAANLARFAAGEPVAGLVDRARGY